MIAGTNILGTWTYGKNTAAAGTVIRQLIRPWRKAFTRIDKFRYTNNVASAVNHLATVRMPLGSTKIKNNVAGGATSITVTGQISVANNSGNRAFAANDLLVIERLDPNISVMTWDVNTISGSPVVNGDGTVTITLGSAAPGASSQNAYRGISGLNNAGVQTNPNMPGLDNAVAGDTVWLMSLSTDIVPAYGATPPQLNLYAGSGSAGVVDWPPVNGEAFISSWGRYQPLVFEVNNITVAGVLEFLSAQWTQAGGAGGA